MKNQKLIKKHEQIIGSFLDVNIPEFDWLKINLEHTKIIWSNQKTNEMVKVDDNYSISINLSEKLTGEDKGLSLVMQNLCGLSFPPYYWKEKTYRFYTSERTGDLEKKKEILNNILSHFKSYEIEKKDKFNISDIIFKEDLKNKIKLETTELLMKFHEPTQRYVVLAKEYLGDKYKVLKGFSEYQSYFLEKKDIYEEMLQKNISEEVIKKYALNTDFFKEELPNKRLEKKSYFFINPSFYKDVKELLILDNKLEKEFIEEQKKVNELHDLSEYNIEDDNIFGIKIKFIPESQHFEFYGKGYFNLKTPIRSYVDRSGRSFNSGGNYVDRGVLPMWALNFIYTENSDSNKNLNGNEILSFDDNREIEVKGKYKIKLNIVPGGSKKEKNLRVLASDWEKLKKIKENFIKEQELWGRTGKSIKISHCDFSDVSILTQYPVVYFDKQGKSFLVYGSRRRGKFNILGESSTNSDFIESIKIDELGNEVKPRNIKFSQTLKGVPITFLEAKFYLENHSFCESIKRTTIDLNAKIWGNNSNGSVTEEEKLKIFETVLLHAEINSNAVNSNTVKSKRIKI